MRGVIFSTLTFVVLVACGGSKPTVDAGPMIDTSCGIDCAAQQQYGLIAGNCFEYTDTQSAVSPPALAAEVKPKLELEGGIPVMQVTYTSGGQRRLQDSFTIVNGQLKLVRREFGPGGISVSYKNASMALEGVQWLNQNTTEGESLNSTSSADVIAGARVSESTTYRVTTSAPGSDLTTPYQRFDAGVRMLITETPDHGSDTRRVWVPGVGFSLITTPLMIAGGTSQEYRLQNFKNINTADAGSCGF